MVSCGYKGWDTRAEIVPRTDAPAFYFWVSFDKSMPRLAITIIHSALPKLGVPAGNVLSAKIRFYYFSTLSICRLQSISCKSGVVDQKGFV